MILVIAEKPSVARDIARVLGAKERGDGYLQNDAYIVSWAVGHLVTQVNPEEIDEKWKRWQFSTLPILPEDIPLKVISKTRSQFSVLKKLMARKDVERLLCATDAGREGELIFRRIYQMAKCQKPFDRLWISSMTDEAIREGFASIRPGSEYDTLYESARCRSDADWLVGMNGSRAFTLKYDVLLSVGRVQTPTLKLLVDRRREIEAFVPEEYHELTANFGDYTGTWFDPAAPNKAQAGRIPTAARAKELAALIKNKPARVTEAETEEKRVIPPQLYDLTSLQRDANQRFGLSAANTLSAAQSLYEKHKVLTYPRTDSRYLPQDMTGKVKQTMGSFSAPYAEFALPLLANLPHPGRIFNDKKVTDHHAIIPTGRKVSGLSEVEQKIYDLVARRFIAAFYPDYVYDATRIVTQCEGESFVSHGQQPKAKGWRALYQDDKPEGDETVLPPLQIGDTRTVQSTKVQKKATKPPSPLTEATLLRAMETAGRIVEDEELRESMLERGLGTPATRAAIIERLIDVGYVERKRRALHATDKGVQLIAAVPETLSSPEMTGRWEKALNDIRLGGMDGERFLQSIRAFTTHLVQFAAESQSLASFAPEERKSSKKGASKPRTTPVEGAKCPLCGGQVTENSAAFSCANWKSGPCAFTIWKNMAEKDGGPTLTASFVARLLRDGRLRGSTGEFIMENGKARFVPVRREGTLK